MKITNTKMTFYYKVFKYTLCILYNKMSLPPYEIKNDGIIFNDNFDESIEPYLKNISKYSKLTFSDRSKFNKSIDNLHVSLKHLTLGDGFNQSVDNLPENLTHLTFGGFFNQQIKHLPKNITHLTFYANYCKIFKFEQKFKNISKKLKILKISPKYKYKNNIVNFGFTKQSEDAHWIIYSR